MGLHRLEISHFRNLQKVSIEPDAGLNLITGENAAGKTSLLEAIFYLSYGRSFRNAQIKHLINQQNDFFRLVTILDDQNTRIGLQRDLTNQTIRVNHQSVTRLSELASLLPVLVLHPDSHQLISAGPEFRRQFLDWGVFHVEHQFLDTWKKYKTALSQRNSALRQQQTDKLCSLWDNELIQHATVITQNRVNYLESITGIVADLSKSLFPDKTILLNYRQGWPTDITYSHYLAQNLAKDKEKGFTQSGPHRADIKITLDGQPSQSSISRGQQKKLVCLLKIAQLILYTEISKKRCILLFDDLPAELDSDNQNSIMKILSTLDIQLFVTAITADQIDCHCWANHKVFHVEHGEIRQQD